MPTMEKTVPTVPVTPLLSIVIVSYNTRQMTLDCLRALYDVLETTPEAQEGAQPGRQGAEVWVVDNASTDGSAEAIQATFPAVRLIANTDNKGFGTANNQALRQSDSPFALLLNSDAFVQPGALSLLLQYLRAHPDVTVVGPRLLNRDGTLQPSCYKFPTPFRAFCDNLLLTARWPNHPVIGDYRNWAHDTERLIEFPVGACVLVRRAALQTVGLFDEAFFLYAEETDWFRRITDAGGNIAFLPSAQVVHWNGGSGKAQSDRVFCEFWRGQERYMRKHHGVCGLWFYRWMLIVGACLRITLFSLQMRISASKRQDLEPVVAQWRRILGWVCGRRGPGLKPKREE